MPTTIQVSERLKKRLLAHKEHSRQPYEEIIAKALDLVEEDELELNAEYRKKILAARRDLKAGRYVGTKDLIRELGL